MFNTLLILRIGITNDAVHSSRYPDDVVFTVENFPNPLPGSRSIISIVVIINYTS